MAAVKVEKIKDKGGKSRGFYQGYYRILNPQKYLDKTKPPIYRSSWEHDACTFFDLSPNVLRWISEPTKFEINYEIPDGSGNHRYHPDFYAEIIVADGHVQKFLIEVKPVDQSPRHSPPPKEPKIKNTKTMSQYSHKIKTYYVNKLKWDATEAWLKKYHPDIQFFVLTEAEAKSWKKPKKKR